MFYTAVLSIIIQHTKMYCVMYKTLMLATILTDSQGKGNLHRHNNKAVTRIIVNENTK